MAANALDTPLPQVPAGRGARGLQSLPRFARFVVVGGCSYALNLTVFALLLAAGINFRLAAVGAFAVSFSNAFYWHRRWTFDARAGVAHAQLARFVTVYAVAFAVSFAVLNIAVDAGLSYLLGQAIGALVAVPVSFTGNHLWTFKHGEQKERG